MSSPAARYDVFLSHNSADERAIQALADRLRTDGLTPFLDVWHLVPGTPRQEGVEAALENSETVAVFIGPSGISPWHNEEMRSALAKAVDKRNDYRVIPVLLPGADEGMISGFLALRVWVDFRSGINDHAAFQRLVAGIKGEAFAPGVFELPDDPAPYRGLLPFDTEHERFFFGRDEDTNRLVEKLGQERFVAVVGASGSGKSSLVKAGLLPKLAKNALPDSATWRVLTMTPGREPLRSLANQLATLAPATTDRLQTADALTERLLAQHDGLRTALDAYLAEAPRPVLLFVDQFEELFTQCAERPERCRAQAEQFVANLADAVQPGAGQIRVLITLRADFLERCLKLPALREMLQDRQVLLGPMDEAALRKAITRPAQEVGALFEKGLVSAILRDVGDEPGCLPLLEHALHELWIARRGPWLTLDAYAASGGVQGALNRRAQATYDALDANQKQIARNIFLRLTALGEGVADTRRRARCEELYTVGTAREEVDAVVQALAASKARLLVVDGESVQVVHEALIQGWDTLRDWLEKNRDALRLQRRLTEAAAEWEAKKRPPDYLYRGARLDDVKDWVATNGGGLNENETAFVKASLELRDLEAAEQDANRQKELEQAQRLAEEQRLRAEEGEQAARRLRRRLVAVGVSGALALLAFVAAAWFAVYATRQQDIAENEAGNAVRAAATATVAQGQALEELANSQRNESLYFAMRAQESLNQDALASLNWAAQALPELGSPRPYVPEAEFALTQALRANLEEGYYSHQDALLERSGQIGFGPTSIAVGGKNPWLIGYDLEPITTQAILSDTVLGVEWRVTDAMPDRLLTYDKNSVDILEVTAGGVHHSGAQQVECLAAAHCAGWRPNSEDVLILDGRSVKLWTPSTDIPGPLCAAPEASEYMKGFDWTDDGQRLAVWDSADTLWVWETGKGVTLTITGTEEARFVDKDQLVVSKNNPNAIQLMSVDGTELGSFPTDGTSVEGIELNRDGSQLAAVFGSGDARLYDVASLQKLYTLPKFTALAWLDADHPYLAVGVKDGSIHIRKADDGTEVMVLRGHTDGRIQDRADVLGLQWMKDRQLLSAGMDGSLRLWRVFDAQGQPLCNSTDSSGEARCRTFSREFPADGIFNGREFPVHWIDDTTAVFLDEQGGGWRWSLTGDGSGDEVEAIWPSTESGQQSMLVGQPGGAHVLHYHIDGDGQVWNAQSGEIERPIPGPIVLADWPDWQENEPVVVKRDGDDLQIAIGYSKTIPLSIPSVGATVRAIALRGGQLAIGWSTGLLQLWDYQADELLANLQDPLTDDGRVIDLQWLGDAPRLLSVQPRRVRLWDTTTEQPLWVWPPGEALSLGGGLGAAPTADGGLVALRSGTDLYVLDGSSGQELTHVGSQPNGHTQTIKNLNWVGGRAWPGQSPSANEQEPLFLTTWAGDCTARLWYWDSTSQDSGLKETWRATEPTCQSVEGGAINHNGSWILTVRDDGTLRAWQAWVSHPEDLIKEVQSVLQEARDRRRVDEPFR